MSPPGKRRPSRATEYIARSNNIWQQRFTADDFDEMTRDALAGRDSAKLKELRSFVPVCNKGVF